MSGLHVLILEDRPDDADLMVHELRRSGFDPVWHRVDTEREYLAHLGPNWEIILADYTLPQFTALRALLLLQERKLDIPFIVVTGSISEEAAVECMKHGAADYLLKDRLSRLGPAVERALEAKRIRAEKQRAEAELRTSEERFRRLAENARDVIYRYRLAPDRGFDYVSPAATQITGYAPEEYYADPDLHLKLALPDDRPLLEAMIRSDAELHHPVTLRWLRKDGTMIWAELRNVPIYDKEGNLIAIEGIARDVTEQKSAEAQLRQLNARLAQMYQEAVRDSERRALLHRASQEIVRSSSNPEHVYQMIHRTVAGLMPCDILAIMLRDEARQCDDIVYVADRMGRRLKPSLPVDAILSGAVMSRGETLLIDDLRPTTNDGETLADGEMRSLLAVPLRLHDGPIGALFAQSREPHAYTVEDKMFLEMLAAHAGAVVEIVRLLDETRRHVQRLSALRDIDLAITGSVDIRVSLTVLLDHVTNQLHVDAADVLLLQPQTQMLTFAAGRGFRTLALQHTLLRVGEGYAGRVVLERRPMSLPDLRNDPSGQVYPPFLASEGFVAYYAVPLIAKGDVKGVLELFHRAPLSPDNEWLTFVDMLAAQAAVALDNALLFADLQRSNVELTLAYDSTLEGWARAADLRDRETQDHTVRVAQVAVWVARALGMSDAEIMHLRRGALLHDIGKMAVPDSVLFKPGPLTAEEWEMMRQHPVWAYEMLSHIDFLRPALDIPYCHHERWDGSGYPRGLKGEAIPLTARIFAVVDVWDALRSDRPYRSAWPAEKVLAYLQEQAGRQFDPRVVEAFLEIERLMRQDVPEQTQS